MNTQTNSKSQVESVGPSPALIARMATVAYAAHRELGLTHGVLDQPTWQIAREAVKSMYRRSAYVLWGRPGLELVEFLEELKGTGPIEGEVSRIQLEIFRGVVEGFRRSLDRTEREPVMNV